MWSGVGHYRCHPSTVLEPTPRPCELLLLTLPPPSPPLPRRPRTPLPTLSDIMEGLGSVKSKYTSLLTHAGRISEGKASCPLCTMAYCAGCSRKLVTYNTEFHHVCLSAGNPDRDPPYKKVSLYLLTPLIRPERAEYIAADYTFSVVRFALQPGFWL